MEFFLRLRGGKISSGRGQLHFLIVMMTQMKSRREEIATIARQDNERLGLITFVNTTRRDRGDFAFSRGENREVTFVI